MSLGLEPILDAESLPVCSPTMRKYLLEGDSAFAAARAISNSPALLDEAAKLQSVIAAAAIVVDAGTLFDILDNYAPEMHVPVPDEDHRAVFWNAYFRELQTFGAESIRSAFAAWRRGEWDAKRPEIKDVYPQPSQLAKLAQAHRGKLGQMKHRVQKALEMAPHAPAKMDPEERAKVAEGMKELAASFKPKELPEAMAPRLTREQVADRLRAMGKAPIDDVGIVL